MKITTSYIFIYALIATGLLFITENFYHPVYIIQMTQKVLTFLVIPLFVTYFLGKTIGRFGRIEKSSVIYGVSFGLFSVLTIGVAYLLLRETIDWNAIQTSVEAR